jgi:tetratricopeptide (TPR) repeat protein
MPLGEGVPQAGGVVELRLHGSFAVTAPDGSDLTPKPHKARALLALVATSPDRRRSRRWIEERLWSDRGPQQAAGSLRQALVDLRKALGLHGEVLQSDREWIALDGEAVRLAPDEGREFLEGIAVRDPAFLRWVEGLRRRSIAAAAPATAEVPSAAPIVIRIGTTNLPGTGSGTVAEIVSSRIAADIADHVTAEVVSSPRGSTLPCDLDVTCNVVEDNGICLAFIKVVHQPSARVLFAKDCRFVGTAASLVGSEALISAAYEAAERAVARAPHMLGLARAATKSSALGQLALHRMFSFDQAQLAEADRLMEAAWEVEENPVHLAWRGLLQMVKAIEQPQALRPELHDLADKLTHYALERDDGNATVKALVAQTQAMLFGDARAAGQAASRALGENPRNPYALIAMAVAQTLAGEGEEAYRLSRLGRTYADRSAFRHWWDAHHATVCIATGRHDEAIAAAEATRFAAPSMRGPYRFLLALYSRRGDILRADEMKGKLEALEPGFTLDRMIEDPAYPVRTLRRAGLLKEVRKLL